MQNFRGLRCQIAVAAVGLFVLAESGSAQLLVNGSFELPSIAANTLQQVTPTSWSWASQVGWIFNGSVGPIWPVAYDGVQFVDIGNESIYSLSQTFTIVAPGPYQLGWWDSAGQNIPGYETSPYRVDVLDASLQAVASASLDAYHPKVWQYHSLVADLALGEYTVRFTAEGVFNGTDSLIDNVAISAVPEVPVYSTLLVGCIALSSLRRRRGVLDSSYSAA